MWQMLASPSTYVRYAYGASCSTWNMTFIAWVIFSPTNELLSSWGIYLGLATNNVMEYSAVIKLMSEASTLGIHWLLSYPHSMPLHLLGDILLIRDKNVSIQSHEASIQVF